MKSPSKDLQIATEIATSFEGLRLEAYCDTLKYVGTKYVRDCRGRKSDRRSIGYGTISHKGETITKIEAEKRMMEFFKGIEKYVDYDCYNSNQKGALLDFMYNAGRNTKHNKTGRPFIYYVSKCDKGSIKQFLYPGNYTSKGLKKRRNAEYLKFIN